MIPIRQCIGIYHLKMLKIGTTFSYREAKQLGMDWQESLGAILNLGLNPIRVGTYWREIEKKPGQFDFSIQDKIIEQIAKTKTDIVLTIGMKAPRWPEFYFPEWLEKKINLKKGQEIEESLVGEYLFRFIEKTLNRYRKNIFIKWINVENEPLTYSGPIEIKISPALLKSEVLLTQKIMKKPVILNSWTELHPIKRKARDVVKKERTLETCLELGNILGLSAYPKFPGQPKIKDQHWQFLKKWRLRAEEKDKEAWVTELQAEPWEKSDNLKNFQDPFGNSSCDPSKVENYIDICQKLGFETILLWGAEFWARCRKEKNLLWWQTIEKFLS